MAYSDNFPQRPVFMADFANGGRIDPRANYTRSTTGTYFGTAKHLSSENLFTYSSPPNGWTLDSFTLTSGQTAPDGSTNAVKLTEDTSGSEHRIYPYSSISTDGGVTTLSGHFKYIGRQWVMFRLNDGAAYRRVWFDIQNGVLGSAETGITHSITASGNGYYKCVATIATSNTSYLPTIGGAPANTGITYTGSGDAFYVWGLQYNHNVGSVLNETNGSIHRQYAPTLQTAAINAPRFEYSATDGESGATGSSLGILIEGQSTNLLAGSATIGGTYWGVVNATSQQNSAMAPDGTLTAATLVENSAGGAKYAYTNNFTPAASTTYTFSVFVKPNGRNFCMIYTGIGGVNQSSMFDLGTGSTSNLSGSATNRATQCGNGWWRLSVTVTTTSTTTANFQILPATDATTFDYTGNGYSGLLCWGAMVEQSSHPSSYIGTTNSAVSRASDSLSADTADIGYTGGPVSIVAEGDSSSDYGVLALLRDSSGSGDVAYLYANPNSTNKAEVYAGGVTSTATATAGTGISALALDTNRLAACRAGGTVTTDTSTALPVLNQLQIGSLNGAYVFLNGHVKRVALFGEALSDSNLISLTK